jgi:hypothetical protein
MKRRISITPWLLAAGLVAAVAALGRVSVARASADPMLDLAKILSATFEGTTPGNELRLNMQQVSTDINHPYDLFLEISGKYQGAPVRRQGLIRLETAGKDVYVGYVPHFDPTVTAMSANATNFTQSETAAACGFHLKPQGDGFIGETVASSCAVALRGVTGKWSIELEPGGLRLRSTESGETLRFRRIGKV